MKRRVLHFVLQPAQKLHGCRGVGHGNDYIPDRTNNTINFIFGTHREAARRPNDRTAATLRTLQEWVLTVHYRDIADRLRAFRLGSGLSAEEIARRAGISRTALYRLEKGELVKIETLERIAELLGVSVTTLLGVGIEYIASSVSYFERLRQIEASAEHITALAGPMSFLLSSDAFEQTLDTTLRESVPDDDGNRPRILEDISKITAILRERKQNYRKRQPSIVNLMSGLELTRFVRDGMVGRFNLPEAVRAERRELAARRSRISSV